MDIGGMFCGLAAAVMQALSYIFSKHYTLTAGNAFSLTIYSQAVMGILALITLLVLFPFVTIPVNLNLFLLLAGLVLSFFVGQFGFFCAQKYIESSRLSSFLGLKIITLAFICIILFGTKISVMQWGGVLLCATAGFGMNFAGGKVPVKGMLWLMVTLLGYSFSDLASAGLVHHVQAKIPLIKSIGAVGIGYLALGISSLFVIPWMKKGKRGQQFFASAPFGVVWFFAMYFLFYCFGNCGVVLGVILQSTRGFFSVLLGLLVLKLGFSNLDSPAASTVWIRRFLMALLMILSVAFYSIGSRYS